MKLRHAPLAAALLAAPLLATAQDAPPPPIKVLCWNVEHFTDPFDDPYTTADQDDKGSNKNDRQLRLMAQAIKAANADVIAFQEIEGDRAAKFFLDNYLPGHEYKYFASVPSLQWYQNVAVVSKLPLGPMVSFREVEIYNEVLDRKENKYNSRLFAVEVKANDDYKFLLTNLHLKSGSDPEDPIWRKKQIAVIKDYLDTVTTADPQANILVVGDMNFTPESEEYTAMTTSGGTKLIDPFAGRMLFTHSSRNPTRQIDFAFFSQGMAPEYVADSAAVAIPIPHAELAMVSDHLPVVISFIPRNAPAAEK